MSWNAKRIKRPPNSSGPKLNFWIAMNVKGEQNSGWNFTKFKERLKFFSNWGLNTSVILQNYINKNIFVLQSYINKNIYIWNNGNPTYVCLLEFKSRFVTQRNGFIPHTFPVSHCTTSFILVYGSSTFFSSLTTKLLPTGTNDLDGSFFWRPRHSDPAFKSQVAKWTLTLETKVHNCWDNIVRKINCPQSPSILK